MSRPGENIDKTVTLSNLYKDIQAKPSYKTPYYKTTPSYKTIFWKQCCSLFY